MEDFGQPKQAMLLAEEYEYGTVVSEYNCWKDNDGAWRVADEALIAWEGCV
eukprot:CAMPEP_0204381494 /NCGR_PEP_ID=MMETSP0469-20131031/54288_1 /ASSEMBLY_ACC=CAM_ASM_000384 /TAXON_ID=2969 /ORGANISM="Oxyrrhis marina" /LENGTH=50 /DNA_ID=CAMNT_0051373349 /DNA_START=26 /DNA_END=179 /DNA_ORIENTATION=-